MAKLSKEIIIPIQYSIRCEFQNSKYDEIIVRAFSIEDAYNIFKERLNEIKDWNYAKIVVGKSFGTTNFRILKECCIEEKDGLWIMQI